MKNLSGEPGGPCARPYSDLPPQSKMHKTEFHRLVAHIEVSAQVADEPRVWCLFTINSPPNVASDLACGHQKLSRKSVRLALFSICPEARDVVAQVHPNVIQDQFAPRMQSKVPKLVSDREALPLR